MAHFNFRLFLRPTLVGKIIIDRLTAECADRQAEARRWIELGYMCEQAGFRLDGNTLFQAGRPVAAEASPAVQVPVHSLQVAAVTASESPQAIAQESRQLSDSLPSSHQAMAPRPTEQQAPSPAAPTAANQPAVVASVTVQPAALASPSQLDSDLMGNLRNLAH